MSFKIKTTTKLFFNKYAYKIVVLTKDSYRFRKTNEEGKYKINDNKKRVTYNDRLMTFLNSLQDYEIRVESPYVSVYSNTKKDIDFIASIDSSNVKYTCEPSKNSNLTQGVVILPKINFEFKVTLGSTNQSYDAFVQWAENNPKVKLTKSCKIDLCRKGSWGGVYFYITGDKNLLMARMHLGGVINRVDKILKA